MKQKILWIVPSRNRPEKLRRFISSWIDCTSGDSDLLIALDLDDFSCDHLIDQFPQVIWEKGPGTAGAFLEILNRIAIRESSNYAYIGFCEDDAIFQTPGYEGKFIHKLQELGKNAMVYANDLINKKGRIYFPVLDSSIIRRLGFMVPPSFRCMYADDFWRDLAEHLGTVYRFADITIQHLHYSREPKRKKDQISESVDSFKSRDAEAYMEYLEKHFAADLKKLQKTRKSDV